MGEKIKDMIYLGMFRGEVDSYDVRKSWGHISPKEMKVDGYFSTEEFIKQNIKGDAFIYFTDIEPEKDGFKKLIQGQVVEFEMYKGRRGLAAKKVKIIGESYDEFGNIRFYTDDNGEISGNL